MEMAPLLVLILADPALAHDARDAVGALGAQAVHDDDVREKLALLGDCDDEARLLDRHGGTEAMLVEKQLGGAPADLRARADHCLGRHRRRTNAQQARILVEDETRKCRPILGLLLVERLRLAVGRANGEDDVVDDVKARAVRQLQRTQPLARFAEHLRVRCVRDDGHRRAVAVEREAQHLLVEQIPAFLLLGGWRRHRRRRRNLECGRASAEDAHQSDDDPGQHGSRTYDRRRQFGSKPRTRSVYG
jgi:hypothetical protein